MIGRLSFNAQRRKIGRRAYGKAAFLMVPANENAGAMAKKERSAMPSRYWSGLIQRRSTAGIFCAAG